MTPREEDEAAFKEWFYPGRVIPTKDTSKYHESKVIWDAACRHARAEQRKNLIKVVRDTIAQRQPGYIADEYAAMVKRNLND